MQAWSVRIVVLYFNREMFCSFISFTESPVILIIVVKIKFGSRFYPKFKQIQNLFTILLVNLQKAPISLGERLRFKLLIVDILRPARRTFHSWGLQPSPFSEFLEPPLASCCLIHHHHHYTGFSSDHRDIAGLRAASFHTNCGTSTFVRRAVSLLFVKFM